MAYAVVAVSLVVTMLTRLGVAEVDVQIGDPDAQVVQHEIADPGVVQDVGGW